MKGNLTGEVLGKYISPVFFETGTYQGHSVKLAITLGFEEVYSVEKNKLYFRACMDKFRGTLGVHLHLGDSSECLWDLIKKIDKRITFWLDGHNVHEIPVLKELEIIARHPIKDHIIMVDDRRVMGTEIWNGITEQDVIQAIYKINPDYTILYEDSLNAPKDIIVACITDNME
jgi:hypothetical protein